MTLTDKKKIIYADCRNVQRTKPNYTVNEEISKHLGNDYRTLPSFEKGLFEEIYKNHYSLQRNELLKCRWRAYKKHLEERIFAPFQFPDVRDLHFHNSAIRFVPKETIHKFPEYRMKLKPGPGVDNLGQMPIPQELLMKRVKVVKSSGKTEKKKNINK